MVSAPRYEVRFVSLYGSKRQIFKLHQEVNQKEFTQTNSIEEVPSQTIPSKEIPAQDVTAVLGHPLALRTLVMPVMTAG
jgi:hypothetical protein